MCNEESRQLSKLAIKTDSLRFKMWDTAYKTELFDAVNSKRDTDGKLSWVPHGKWAMPSHLDFSSVWASARPPLPAGDHPQQHPLAAALLSLGLEACGCPAAALTLPQLVPSPRGISCPSGGSEKWSLTACLKY